MMGEPSKWRLFVFIRAAASAAVAVALSSVQPNLQGNAQGSVGGWGGVEEL